MAQKKFVEKSKRLEKYEAEVDNSHTKMQDVLESIIAIRDQVYFNLFPALFSI